jgi:hypothetical protein
MNEHRDRKREMEAEKLAEDVFLMLMTSPLRLRAKARARRAGFGDLELRYSVVAFIRNLALDRFLPAGGEEEAAAIRGGERVQ